jgi:hypothetical protein
MTIVLDFDGTVLTHDFPELGKDIGAIPVLKELVANGHQLVLFTMRCDNQKEQVMEDGYKMHGGDFLTQAVNWFKEMAHERFIGKWSWLPWHGRYLKSVLENPKFSVKKLFNRI